jgi:hypothetical protein
MLLKLVVLVVSVNAFVVVGKRQATLEKESSTLCTFQPRLSFGMYNEGGEENNERDQR